MSSRAHRPADEGLGDFAASERISAGTPREEGVALEAEVISSEREASAASTGEAPVIASPSGDSSEADASLITSPAEVPVGRAGDDGVAPQHDSAAPAEPEPSVAGRGPSASGEVGSERDAAGPVDTSAPVDLDAATPEPPNALVQHGGAARASDARQAQVALQQLEALLDQPEHAPQPEATGELGDDVAVTEPTAAVQRAPEPLRTQPGRDEDQEQGAEDEPESIEVESRDIEPAELVSPAGEGYAAEAPDVSEMTADELALATQPEGSEQPAWEGEELEPAAGGPGEAGAERGARFDAPWVDEVPDPVTPYEQRISETVRVADLPPAEQLRGRVLANRYIAEEIAEQTASSITYRAYHLALDRAVSVKILPRGLACPEETCQEVRRVAAIANGIAHPNVAMTLDFGVLPDGWPYLVTEQLAGLSLAVLLRQEGKFVLRRVLHVGKQLAAGLGAAHAAGLVHGLLNPDSVFVIDPGTSAEVATIVGFGVSSARGAVPGTPRSGVFGVPFYVSPEQAGCRPLDARSDIYSLGVVLYELMTGRPPFTDGDFAGVLCQHLDDEAPPPSSRLRSPGALAKAMDAIIQRCLRKEPARRYQTAAELAEDLIRLEAAAARTKRRPMPEVKRPTTTIHSPPPKAAEGAVGPEAKVIVHDDPDEELDVEAEASGSQSGGPPSRPRPGPTTPVTSAAASVRDKAAVTVARPPVTRAPRISVDQATIKISAVDRARFVRPGAPLPAAPRTPEGDSESGGLVRWIGSALKRLFGGPNDTEKP